MTRLLLTLALVSLLPRFAAAQQPETIEYYAQDAIGSIRVVFKPPGRVLARQDYAPFGRPLFTVPAMPKEELGGVWASPTLGGREISYCSRWR